MPSRTFDFIDKTGFISTLKYLAASLPTKLVAVGLVMGLSVSAMATPGAGRTCRDLFVAPKSAAARMALEATKTITPADEVRLEKRLKRTHVEIDGQAIYYEALPAAKGKPTAIVFLGLFTPMSDLQKFQASFLKQSTGEGLIVFAYSTSTESLIFGSALKTAKYSEAEGTGLNDYVRQATAVMNAGAVTGPVTVIGYSYGSAPAARFASFHLDRVDNLIFAAPLVYPGEHAPQLLVGKEVAESMAAMNPFFGKTIINSWRERVADDMAQKIVDGFLEKGKFPDFLNPDVVVDSLKAQIRATEEFDLRRETFSQWPKTHFLLAGKEVPSRLGAQREVVDAVQNFKPGHVESVEGGAHAIMADQPAISASMVLRVLRNQ